MFLSNKLPHLNYYPLIRPHLFRLDAEKAHNLSIKALKYGLVPPTPKVKVSNKLSCNVAGLGFDSPVGLAAGYDKNAEVFGNIFAHGFGFAEVGTITPQPQDGNPQPRLFRLRQDNAVINRMGFNNAGMEVARTNIDKAEANRLGVLGVNIGKNKTTENALDDYLLALEYMYDVADYITINISSPNTAGLRDLQGVAQFDGFIKTIMNERNWLASLRGFTRPIFVKLAPDMSDDDLCALLDLMLLYHVDGVILTNTTIARPSSLQSEYAGEQGGLSGEPLRAASLHALQIARDFVGEKMPLISAGGIMNGADAVARIKAGASLVQIYSGLVYHGLQLVYEIKCAILAELETQQIQNVEQLIGYNKSSC
jgi:dihydroorotate dehydrogenase